MPMGLDMQQVKGRRELRAGVMRLAWPAIVENLLHTMVGIVDTAMVGHLGSAALASVGLANQIFNIGLTVFAALATGSTAIVARYVGSKEPDKAGEVARQSLTLGFFCLQQCYGSAPAWSKETVGSFVLAFRNGSFGSEFYLRADCGQCPHFELFLDCYQCYLKGRR